MNEDAPATMLEGLRVLALCDERGLFCGRMLADLGADVLQVEPLAGSRGRRVGPWWPERSGSGASLVWEAWAANSRSITLDAGTDEGRNLFDRLVTAADFVVESLDPGELDRLDLSESALLRVNPRIILVSISGFGRTGPHAHFKAPDLVVMAMSGQLGLTGWPDDRPLRIGAPQAYANACASAAAGALIAHTWRRATGAGQHVDVSAEQSVARSLAQAPGEWDLNRFQLRRQGSGHQLSSGVTLPTVWPCRDGYVSFILFGSRGGRSMNALATWMAGDGLYDRVFNNTDWEAQDFGKVTPEMVAHLEPLISGFFKRHSKVALSDGAAERGIMLFPVNSMPDLLDQPQLRARDFFRTWPGHPELEDRAVFPGAFVRSNETALSVRRPAPGLGQHNREVYLDELGLTEVELNGLVERGIV